MDFITSIKKFIHRFEQLGTNRLNKSSHPYLNPRSVQLTNLMVLLGGGISFLMSICEFLGGQIFYAFSDLVGGLLMLITLCLNLRGCYNCARIFILLILNLDIYYFNSISNFSAGLELLYCTFALVPFFIFSSKEKFLLILTTAIPCAFYCINHFYTQYNLIPVSFQQPAPSWYAIAVPIVTFTVLFVMIYRFLKISEEMQEKVIHSSKFSSLGEMAAGISHEINNPLSAVILNSQLLEKEVRAAHLSESILGRVHRIEKAAKRASQIIHGLKLFSRDSTDDPQTLIDLKECVQETLQLCLQRFEMNGIHFDCVLKEKVLIRGNPTQISQALINLLNNAYDAVVSEKEKWIQLEVIEKQECVEIRISDSGPGISPKFQKNIMEPFFTTKPVNQGTGLGLSITKGIAEAHHGELFLDQKAKHTTFVLSLPRA